MHTYTTTTLLILALSFCAFSCHSSKQTAELQVTEQPALIDGITETPTLPDDIHVDIPVSSIIYKASPEYAQNVPVGVTPSGSAVIYIPSPSDAKVAPVQLADGYWLATIPVGKQTAFTDYTYAEYSKLAKAPSAAEVLSHVIKDARPTAIVRLPMETADTALINKLIREGLPGCKALD